MGNFLNKKDLFNFIGKIGDAVGFAKVVSERLKSSRPLVYERFGTASIWYGGMKIEFASARKEVYETDSRKPEVSAGDIAEDLKRRDFTINALARRINAKSKDEIVDLFGGVDDIKKKLIRTPVEPEISFSDDPLRMLRAVRFAGQFGFRIEKPTFEAMQNNKERIRIVSDERISNELMRILSIKKPSIGFTLLNECGFLKIILPEIESLSGVEDHDGYLHKDVFLHSLRVVDNVSEESDNLNLRFTALMHDIAKPATKRFYPETGWTFYGHDELGSKMVGGIVERMKLPSSLGEYAQKLIRMHLRPISLSEEHVTDSAIRRFIVEADYYLDDLMILCRADITSGNPKRVAAHLGNFKRVIKRIEEVREKDKLRGFKSPVNGHEIMEICKLEPGKKVGILKKMIEDAILDGIITNDHTSAFRYLLKIKDKSLKNYE
ncbi:CCA tRNA nucleotidyltransferase [candidate division KSB1 bacterium]